MLKMSSCIAVYFLKKSAVMIRVMLSSTTSPFRQKMETTSTQNLEQPNVNISWNLDLRYILMTCTRRICPVGRSCRDFVEFYRVFFGEALLDSETTLERCSKVHPNLQLFFIILFRHMIVPLLFAVDRTGAFCCFSFVSSEICLACGMRALHFACGRARGRLFLREGYRLPFRSGREENFEKWRTSRSASLSQPRDGFTFE
jgi:hypothetical protein